MLNQEPKKKKKNYQQKKIIHFLTKKSGIFLCNKLVNFSQS